MARTPSVLIVGAGFGGLAAALELTRHGHDDFVILEKATDLGGVWRENTYPGAACDAPSPIYSFSFAANAAWPKRFAEGPDILRYMHDVVDTYSLREHIRFGVEVTSAEFDEDAAKWRVHTAGGEFYEADVFVPALGLLSRPLLPSIEGLESFVGPWFHSAQWDASVDLAGKRVAVVGTGASAIQIVPAIQPSVGQLTLFQRSAPWIIPKAESYYLPNMVPLLKKVPVVQYAERLGWFGFFEFVTAGLEGHGVIADRITGIANRHRQRQVTDPELLAKVTPDYQAGCKRGLMSNDYYPALQQPNVTVETTAIERVTPRGIVTADGVEHEFDVIVYCTGFKAHEFLAPVTVRGLGGKDLHETWTGGARAYLGLSVPGFPNMFVMYGPNTNLGAGSIIYMLEKQARFVRQAVEHLRSTGSRWVDVLPEVEERFDAEVQERLSRTVWTKCTSWYRLPSGRIVANWPGRMSEYDRRAHFRPADYDAA